MRSNSGSGKSNNNLRDPTMKEHEESRKKMGHRPAHGRAETAAETDPDRRQPAETAAETDPDRRQPAETGPVD